MNLERIIYNHDQKGINISKKIARYLVDIDNRIYRITVEGESIDTKAGLKAALDRVFSDVILHHDQTKEIKQ